MLVEARDQEPSDLTVAMLRDWVERGAESPYALTPDEVVRRSHPRSTTEATAAAKFELGQYLHRNGDHDAAIRMARRGSPAPTTGRTSAQAWNFEDPVRQGHTDVYDSSWFEDIKQIGGRTTTRRSSPDPPCVASVVGNSGSGKSTVAARSPNASARLAPNWPTVNHEADWTPLTVEEFRRQVTTLTDGDTWVVDGNYSAVRDIV